MTMILRKVTVENKSDLEFVEKLYIESFPANERRPVLGMHHIMQDDSRYEVLLLVNQDEVRVGFYTLWTFDDFHFLEHFAVSPEQRNNGAGSEALKSLFEYTTLPLIGEVELPEISEFALRRLNFYKKNGFKAWDMEYAQPPYVDGFDSVPMVMLTYRDIDFPKAFDYVKKTLYREVYQKEV